MDEDPWDWDVERVVEELCTDKWPQKHKSQVLPDPQALERIIRREQIYGGVLLEMGLKDIREEFNLNRNCAMTIFWAIKKWRQRSLKYREEHIGEDPAMSHGNTLSWTLNPASESASPILYSNPLRLIDPRYIGQSPLTHSIENNDAEYPLQGNNYLQSAGQVNQDIESIEDPTAKRAKLAPLDNVDETGIEGSHEPQSSPPIENEADVTDEIVNQILREANANVAQLPSGKKRKRIAPTLITTSLDLDRSREIPTAADNVRLYDPQNVEPGVVFRDETGQKRLILVSTPSLDQNPNTSRQEPPKQAIPSSISNLQNGGERGLNSAKEILRAAETRASEGRVKSLSAGYLGKEKLSVDEIFYKGVGVGEELLLSDEDDGEFVQTTANISSGRRLYLNRRMKFFLRSEPKFVRRDGKLFSGRLPYPNRLAPEHQSPSFTLSYENPKGNLQTTREDLFKWPELDPNNSDIAVDEHNERKAKFDSLIEGLRLVGPDTYGETWDPSLLEKYRHVEGGDEVLPIFGESEDEYDEETWREIREEFEEEEGVEKKSPVARKGQLTEADVNNAIDEGIAQIMFKWHYEKLPGLKSKGWKLWHRARREKNKSQRISQAQTLIKNLNTDRLPKMRREILSEQWASEKQVRRQTQIMEQSIFHREEAIWEILVLESKTAPERLDSNPSAKKLKKTGTSQLDIDEDGESLDTSVESSDPDDLEDFIVSDDEISEPGDDLQSTEMDVSSDDEPLRSKLRTSSKSVENDTRVLKSIFDPNTTMNDIGTDSDEGNRTPRTSSSIPPQTPQRIMSKVEQTRQTPLGSLNPLDRSKLPQVIDLTMTTPENSSSAEDTSSPPVSGVLGLVSPYRPKIILKHNTLPPAAKPQFKRLGSPKSTSSGSISSSKSDVINISDTEEVLEVLEEFELPDPLPSHDDPDGIHRIPIRIWEKLEDRDRLIISLIHGISLDNREGLIKVFKFHGQNELWHLMVDLINDLSRKDRDQGQSQKTLIISGAVRLWDSYVYCKKSLRRTRIPYTVAEHLKNNKALYQPFFTVCQKALKHYITAQPAVTSTEDEDDEDQEPQLSVRKPVARSDWSEDDALVVHKSVFRKRQRKVVENPEARDLREQNRQSQKEEAKRRQVLRERLAQNGSNLNDDRTKIIINESKHDHEGFVFVHEHIGQRIKSHQIEGTRFMWSQIVSKDDPKQGCLLAHTMGLGKTMQVITLLVAIAEAATSKDPAISSQIPTSLQLSRTLILCPPGLIDNWMDELLMWVPEDVFDALGKFRKLDSSIRLDARLDTIDLWYEDGGILIIGYEMFRNLISNRATKARGPPLTDEQHAMVEKQLLEGPNLIVADEAHRMKNIHASISTATSRLRSMSRIALTGSPLANNVEEYHTMIEWVAPNYLGPAIEFRAKYVEPIQQGLWQDSTLAERRSSMKMLRVLKEDLAPKVNRADMSVLRDDLPPKTEFVITVPLTELQKKAYILYVRSMRNAPLNPDKDLTKTGKLQQTTLWHWLAILSLLCNHPECFRAKLTQRNEDAQKEIEARNMLIKKTAYEDAAIDDAIEPVWKVGVSEDLIREQMKLFDSLKTKIEDVDHSYKTKILLQILDASKTVGDKVLIFSQSIPTLNYLEELCKRTNRGYARLDGTTAMNKRQGLTKNFNTGSSDVYLISTTAGGLGLNLQGANRVVIFDFKFNPIVEEQAIGRAYRIGQKKPVFVYRFVAGGTFETKIHNMAVFKMQLSSRVVDKKDVLAWAKRDKENYLFEPKDVVPEDLEKLSSEFGGRDPQVLDKILDSQKKLRSIGGIVMTDTFQRHDDEKLTADEMKEVDQLIHERNLKRTDPAAYQALVSQREWNERERQKTINLAAAGELAARQQAGFNFHGLPMQPLDLPTPRGPTISGVGQAHQLGSGSILPPPRHNMLAKATESKASQESQASEARQREHAIKLKASQEQRPEHPPVLGATTKVVENDITTAVPEVPNETVRQSSSPPHSPSKLRTGFARQGFTKSDVPQPTSSQKSPYKLRAGLLGPSSPGSDSASYQSMIEKLKISLRRGSRLGNFPATDDTPALIADLATKIQLILKRSAGDNMEFLVAHNREMADTIGRDSNLCDQLLYGHVNVQRAVAIVLGQEVADLAVHPKYTRESFITRHAPNRLLPSALTTATAGTIIGSPEQPNDSPKESLPECVRSFYAMVQLKLTAVANTLQPDLGMRPGTDSIMEEIDKVARDISLVVSPYSQDEDATIINAITTLVLEEITSDKSITGELMQKKLDGGELARRCVQEASSRISNNSQKSSRNTSPSKSKPQSPLARRPKSSQETSDREYLAQISARKRTQDTPRNKPSSSISTHQSVKLPYWATKSIEEAHNRDANGRRTPRRSNTPRIGPSPSSTK